MDVVFVLVSPPLKHHVEPVAESQVVIFKQLEILGPRAIITAEIFIHSETNQWLSKILPSVARKHYNLNIVLNGCMIFNYYLCYNVPELGQSRTDAVSIGPIPSQFWNVMTYLQWGCQSTASGPTYRVCLIQAPRPRECRPEKAIAVLILGLHPVNERRCYVVTTSLIGWRKPRISPVLVTPVHYTKVQMAVMPTECHGSDHQGLLALSAIIKLPRKRKCRQIDYIFVTGRTKSW